MEKIKKVSGHTTAKSRKNLLTAISVMKPNLSVIKHDLTLMDLSTHIYETSRSTANTLMYKKIMHRLPTATINS